MPQTIKAVVRYDGAAFAGWQVQPETRTIQGTIEDALETMSGRPIRIAGAGRTDSGVHALGQVFSCQWPGPKSPGELRRSLSKMLGPEIHIESIESVPDDFHALRSATSKRYAYAIAQSSEPDPFLDRYTWTVPWDFDADRVNDLVQRIVGHHDFAGFCSSGSSAETTDRTIHSARVVEGPIIGPASAASVWHIELHGDGFLYKMVRNLVGTVADIARGHLDDAVLEERLSAPKPYRGYTAPAKGLFLVEVEY